MAAGAEGQARVQNEGDPIAAVGLLPLGDDQQPLADLHGLVVLLPVVFPVGVLQVVHGHQQGAAVVPAFLQGLQGDADLAHFGEALLVGGEVEGDLGRAPHLLLQFLVHIVPVLVVVLQEILKFGFVVNHHAVDAQGGEHGLHRLQPGVVRLNMQCKPVHMFLTISPQKQKIQFVLPEFISGRTLLPTAVTPLRAKAMGFSETGLCPV